MIPKGKKSWPRFPADTAWQRSTSIHKAKVKIWYTLVSLKSGNWFSELLVKIFFWKQHSTYNSYLLPWMLQPRKYVTQYAQFPFICPCLFERELQSVLKITQKKTQTKNHNALCSCLSGVSAQPWGTLQLYSPAEWWYAHCRENQPRRQCEYLRNISDLRIRYLLPYDSGH